MLLQSGTLLAGRSDAASCSSNRASNPGFCASALTLFFAAALVPAQTAPPPGTASPQIDDRITVTATGQEMQADDLPISVTLISRAEIERSQEESVVDLLRRVPGLIVMRAGDEGTAGSLFVRGTESDHTLALFDGVRLNSPYFAGHDWSQQTTAGLERIEVARGPFSALWGSDAVGGVVNLVPRRGAREPHWGMAAEAGEDAWQRFEASVGAGGQRWDGLATALDRQGRGEAANSDFSSEQILADVGFSWSEQGRVALLFQDLDSSLGVPFANPLSPTPNRRQGSSQRLFALPLQMRGSARWGLEFTPSLVDRNLTFDDPDDAFGFTRSDTRADTTQMRVASHHDLAGGDHAFTVGAEWRQDEVDASSNFGVDLAGATSSSSGLFVQDVWRASPRLTVIAGARWEDAAEAGSDLSPRVSVGMRVSDALRFTASYGQAFRQPSVGELYFPFSGNRALRSEHSESAEFGFDLRFGGSSAQRLHAALFATDTTDLIDFDFASFAFANIAEVQIRGLEAGWTVPIGRRAGSSLQATWLDSEDEQGRALLRRPRWSASWVFDAELGRRLHGDLAVRFVGERADVDAVTFARVQMPDHIVADLGVALRVAPGFEVTARVQNVADESHQEVAGFPAPGRRILGGLRWSK
jgi:vitamin B12 transporter